jgi:hypothetical protein
VRERSLLFPSREVAVSGSFGTPYTH